MAMGRLKVTERDLLKDRYLNLPPQLKRYIDNSWAPGFYTEVTCRINQDRFKVLYSDNEASRPSTPIAILVAALIIKEMLGLNDDQLLFAIMSDIAVQVALGLTSADTIELSDRSFGRFRQRLNEYKEKTGIDLIEEEEKALAAEFCRKLKIDGKKKRMDSLMVNSRGKYMTRLELIHVTNAKCLKALKKAGRKELIPDSLKHYLNADDTNRIVYHQENEELGPRLNQAINDSFMIKEIMENDEELKKTSEYEILCRMIGEQTVDAGNGEQPQLKDKKDISPDSLQNPNDPDETYRRKADEDHRGYVANIVQTYKDGVSIITSSQYEQNIHSDSDFMKEYLASRKPDDPKEEMVTDGAYKSTENDKLAEEAGVKHYATSLTGTLPDPIVEKFKLSEDGKEVLQCPQKHKPIRCTYDEQHKRVRAVFDKKQCNKSCPFYEHCHPREQKTTNVVMVSKSAQERAKYARKLDTPKYKKKARERNAVEGGPSVMRRRYHIDSIPVFGIIASSTFFHFKIIACNAVSLLTHMHDRCVHHAAKAALA